MTTSARNSFSGTVTAIKSDPIMSEIALATPTGLTVISVITNESRDTLGLKENSPVRAMVKAPWVIIALDGDINGTSARNKFKGRITDITADEIAAEVTVALDEGSRICAVITSESVKSLGLKVGDQVWAMFKASSVILDAD